MKNNKKQKYNREEPSEDRREHISDAYQSKNGMKKEESSNAANLKRFDKGSESPRRSEDKFDRPMNKERKGYRNYNDSLDRA